MDLFYFVIQQTWTFAIPLLIVALAGLFSERSGVINIALEGIMLIGALFGVSYYTYLVMYCHHSLTLLLHY